VGKTTTAAKLAARMLLAGKKPVTLITIDTFRAAAVEQLRVYAGAMGAQFEAARDLEELQESFERHRGAAQLIVDTEGRGQRDLEGLRPLFGFLRARPEVERHLVLSATTKAMDLEETVERFRAAAPDRLLFTKVDETGSYGPILSESVRSGLPVSYLGTGQRIPDELLIATPEKLAELALSSLS
jgi:flagellar biosynthesis protein FlhF